MRHKDLGIWQTLTWAQLLDEVRAYAVGLHRLGLRRGDTMAVVGANRPRLYASVMAAQVLGVEVSYFFDELHDGGAFRATPKQRLLAGLAKNFISARPEHQKAICSLVRTLAVRGRETIEASRAAMKAR